MKRLPANQKIRIICGNVSFYTTAKQIRYGTGALTQFNKAAAAALVALESQRGGDDILQWSVGLVGTFNGFQLQIDMVD